MEMRKEDFEELLRRGTMAEANKIGGDFFGLPVRKSDVYVRVWAVLASAILILLLLTSRLSDVDKDKAWLFGGSMSVAVIFLVFLSEKGRQVDIYKESLMLAEKERLFDIGLRREDISKTEVSLIGVNKLLFTFPTVPPVTLEKTYNFRLTGITGRRFVTADVIIKAGEKSKLVSAAYEQASKDAVLRSELDRRGLRMDVPGAEDEGVEE